MTHVRRKILKDFGASKDVVEELLNYGSKVFLPEESERSKILLPLGDEPFMADWRAYAEEAAVRGAWDTLRGKLPQLSFPISEGINRSDEYRLAVRKGQWVATDGWLKAPEALRIEICSGFWGSIPVLFTPERSDFEYLVRALTLRNEPAPISASMGACLAFGYNNWDKIRRLQSIGQKIEDIIPDKALYQDSIVIIGSGPYSGVSASAMGMDDDQWLAASHLIRLEHECTHYFTRRVFGRMSNPMFDELIADFMGILAVNGTFRAKWLLIFFGLEGYPVFRSDGRLSNYKGNPPLSNDAFSMLQLLVYRAALNLEYLFNSMKDGARDKPGLLATLCSLSLEELAARELSIQMQN